MPFSLFFSTCAVEIYKSIKFHSDQYESISALEILDNGWILGGTRLSSSVPENTRPAFILSKDGGTSWTEINVPGATDKRSYGLSSNGNVVICGRGDLGHPCILRSTDYGQTWSVVLKTADVKSFNSQCSSIYSTVYVQSQNRFLAFTSGSSSNNVVLQSTDGLSWEATDLFLPGAIRNAYYVKDMDLVVALSHNSGSSGIFLMRSGSQRFETHLSGKSISAFIKLPTGTFLCSAWKRGTSADDIAIQKASRIDGMLTLKAKNSFSGLNIGDSISFSIAQNSPFSSPTNCMAKVLDVTKNTITIAQEGSDTSEVNVRGVVYRSTGVNTIYKSTDQGNNWYEVHSETLVTKSNYPPFSRTFAEIQGAIFISCAGYEDDAQQAGLGTILRSDDDGDSWYITEEITGVGGRKLNALYRQSKLNDNTVIVTGQYQSPVIFLYA